MEENITPNITETPTQNQEKEEIDAPGDSLYEEFLKSKDKFEEAKSKMYQNDQKNVPEKSNNFSENTDQFMTHKTNEDGNFTQAINEELGDLRSEADNLRAGPASLSEVKMNNLSMGSDFLTKKTTNDRPQNITPNMDINNSMTNDNGGQENSFSNNPTF